MKNTGFSVVEVILAAGIFAFFSSAAVVVLLQGMDMNRLGAEQTIAGEYASEGLEAVRSIKNQAFSNIAAVNPTPRGLDVSTGIFRFKGDGTNDVLSAGKNYTRQVKIEPVSRDANGNIVAAGGTDDPNSKKVTSSVNWSFSAARSLSVDLISYLTDWRKPLAVTGGVIVYGDTTAAPKFRPYDSSAGTFGAESPAVTGSSGLSFMVRTSPTKKEAVAGYVNSSGVLQIMCYDGTSWTNEWTAAVGAGATRRFDIGYETASGKAIVIYSRNAAGANAVAYRTKPGSTACGSANWTSEINFPASPSTTTGTVQWVKVAADKRLSSNLMTAIWADSNADLGAAVWSGTDWGNFKLLENALELVSTAQDVDSFALDYESLTGNVMVVWGSGGSASANGAYYNRCTGGTSSCSWGSSRTAITSMANDATNLDLASNPDTDEMVFASIGNAGSDLQAAYWNGSAWSGRSDIDTSAAAPLAGNKLVAAGWLVNGTTARSIIVYNDSNAANIGWIEGAGGTFTQKTDWAPAPSFGKPQKWYEVDQDPVNKDRLLFTLSDNNSDLFAKQLIMTAGPAYTWSDADSKAALEATLGQTTASPFSFAYWRNP